MAGGQLEANPRSFARAAVDGVGKEVAAIGGSRRKPQANDELIARERCQHRHEEDRVRARIRRGVDDLAQVLAGGVGDLEVAVKAALADRDLQARDARAVRQEDLADGHAVGRRSEAAPDLEVRDEGRGRDRVDDEERELDPGRSRELPVTAGPRGTRALAALRLARTQGVVRRRAHHIPIVAERQAGGILGVVAAIATREA
jgi:hypothetical protein